MSAAEPLPRENGYTCRKCARTVVTVDVDYGVTPFMIRCKAKKGCDGDATSAFYPKMPRPKYVPDPTFEWYRPETLVGLSSGERSHVLQGGLLIRPRTDRAPTLHGESGDVVQQKIQDAIERLQSHA